MKDLEGKDAELEEVRNENLGLEEKLNSLLAAAVVEITMALLLTVCVLAAFLH